MLAYHILIPVISAIIMNGIIYALHLNKINSKELNKLYIPPGYIIGIIWTILFALLGYVHYLLYKLNH
jgi:tryptophan-rich sensory protein